MKRSYRLTCTRHLRQSPAFTSDFATHLAAYAAERSTLVKSLPENAPPPCAPQPPLFPCEDVATEVAVRAGHLVDGIS
ncbi:hypothetical protein B566_EDAN011180 [Ephemera danica]|nr:hypothetical protein B566_EDAN011180 [Ephemera danica]